METFLIVSCTIFNIFLGIITGTCNFIKSCFGFLKYQNIKGLAYDIATSKDIITILVIALCILVPGTIILIGTYLIVKNINSKEFKNKDCIFVVVMSSIYSFVYSGLQICSILDPVCIFGIKDKLYDHFIVYLMNNLFMFILYIMAIMFTFVFVSAITALKENIWDHYYNMCKLKNEMRKDRNNV